MSVLEPSDAKQIAEMIAWVVAEGDTLEIVAGGTKRALGRPMKTDHVLDVSGLSEIVEYEPAELVLTAQPGASLASINAELAKKRQMLAFEPPDWRALLGSEGEPTLGGVIACNLAGSRRVRAGSARDYILGFRRRKRLRRNLEGRRQGRQERHWLRHVQAAGGRLWHVVGADRAHRQSHAET